MKRVVWMYTLATVVLVSGCATTSQVEELIGASNQSFKRQVDEHAASIDLLKKSSIAALEKNKTHADTLTNIDARLMAMEAQLKLIQGFADAAKVMSAANTVKVANLDAALSEFKAEQLDTLRQLGEMDKLHESVLIEHYKTVVDSAMAAIESLAMDGVSSSNDAPVELAAPIEIIAPDTSVITNVDTASTNLPAGQ